MDLFFSCATSLFGASFRLFYRCKIYGTQYPYHGAAIIAPNHASFLDPPLISGFWPEETHFVARASLFKSRFSKWLFQKLHAHPVSGSSQNAQTMRLICQLLSEGQKVVIFPEGARSEHGELQPLKTGISMLALRMKCPIIPVYIHGTYDAWPKHSKWPKIGSKIACVFGKPIKVDSYLDLDKKEAQTALAKQVQLSIEELKKWYEAGAQGDVP